MSGSTRPTALVGTVPCPPGSARRISRLAPLAANLGGAMLLAACGTSVPLPPMPPPPTVPSGGPSLQMSTGTTSPVAAGPGGVPLATAPTAPTAPATGTLATPAPPVAATFPVRPAGSGAAPETSISVQAMPPPVPSTSPASAPSAPLPAASAAAGALPPPAPVPSAVLSGSFVKADHDPYLLPGTASIAGQSFLRESSASLVTCQGSGAMALPATPFFREATRAMQEGRRPVAVERIDPSYRPLVRQSTCDDAGRFRFENLAGGRWQVLTKITYTDATGMARGGWMVKEVTLDEGQIATVRLSEADLPPKP